MPAWQPSGGSGGSVDFKETGSGGGGAPIYHPTASGGGTGQAGGVAGPTPGSISINPLDPAGSLKAAGESGGNFIDGLAKGIFGVQLADGSHAGGVPILSNIAGAVAAAPVVNTLVGTAGDILGGAGDVVKNAADVVGGALEHAPGVPGGEQILDAKFADPAVQSWLDEPADPHDPASKTHRELLATEGQNFDKGLLGTGVLGSEAHMKNVVLREFAKAQAIKNPTFDPGAFQAPGSLADTVTFLLNDTLGVASQAYQTGIARLHGRAEEAAKLASGDYVSTGFLGTGILGGDAGATSAEQLAAEKMKDGTWTSDQATDFLVTAGQTAHDARLSIALAVASPDVAASFGMGAVAKLGAKGASLFRTVGEAEAIIATSESALTAANAAKLAAKAAGATSKEIRAASKAIRVAKADLADAQAAREALTAGKLAGTTLRFGEKYASLADASGVRTMTGRVAKYTRTLIDPMHALDLKLPGKARLVDLASDRTTKVLADVTGHNHYGANLEHFRQLDTTGTLVDKYARDLATASTNRAREGLLTMHQVSAVMKGLGGRLAGTRGANREEVIENAANAVKDRSLSKWLREDYTKNVLQQDWNEAAHADLGRILEAHYGVPAAEWAKTLPKMSKEQKSLLKFAAYGKSNSNLLKAVSDSAGHVSATTFDLNRVVLLSKNTLTRVGGESLLSKLKTAKTKAAVALIREWQARYPELRYITIDASNPGKSVQQMVDYLDKNLERLPMQVKADELKGMHDSMKTLSASLGDNYQLGFRPKDEFLWGIERANQAGGEYIARRAPWADHVGEGGLGFRPGHEVPLNIAGLPIIGPAAKVVGKSVDYMQAGARMLGAQVSGQQVHEIARQRFVSEASRGKFAEAGLTENVAGKWFDRLQEYTKEHQGYSGPRGFGKGDLYNAIDKERLIPQTLLNGAMRVEPEDILRMTLDAYDGDMRFIGLTQKLSSRAKRVLSLDGRTNFTGQIAEHAWPTLKFRYNPLFQLQEKIEPVVLNAQRGVSFAARPRMTAADRGTERLLQRMTENSIIRQGDVDMFEQSMYALFGKRMENLAKTPGSKMSAIQGAAASFMDVQGLKRINMVRTFRHGLGKELRSVYNEAEPGLWDQMYEHASAKSGRLLNEDEFAVQVMSENLLGNDIKVTGKTFAQGGTDILKADWSNAVKTGAWHVPSHIGQLSGLDLEHIAVTMNTRGVDGKRIENLSDLRKYIAEDHGRISEVTEYLNRLGAHKDYVARVENALTFSWEGFWQEASKRFSLTSEESMALQDMVGESAKLRGMAPTDFLSQVYHPGIIDGTEGIIGSLDRPLGVLRRNAAGQVAGRGRSRLAGEAGKTNREDLVRQLSGVFSAHLDPSAKRALLMEFKPELRQAVLDGKVRLDLTDLQKMWDSDAEGQLADRILNYMDGRAGTGAADTIKDAARGDANIRAGADRYLQNHGVTPLGERRHYKVDEAHYQQVADEYSALPTLDYEKTGRRPMSKQVYAADTDLKPKPAGVDQRTYDAYQQFVHETRDQWDHMTAPKAKGGMGITVTVAKGEPYTTDAAGRAAMMADLKKGKLRVKGTDSDHPLMTNEQTIQFRAVHDVFGHAGQGFEFGPRGELNAAAEHFKMYGPEARGPLLTETHGQTAYVNYSNDLYTPPAVKNAPTQLDPANPIASFEKEHPYVIPERQQEAMQSMEAELANPDVPADVKAEIRRDMEAPGTAYVSLGMNKVNGVEDFVTMRYDKLIGDGFRGLPAAQQHIVLQQLHELLTQFPDMKVHHIDIVNLGGTHMIVDPKDPQRILQYGFGDGVNGVAFGADEGEGVILLNEQNFGMDYQQSLEHAIDQSEDFRNRPFTFTEGKDPVTGQTTWTRVPRQSNLGVPHNAGVGPEHVVRHEAGHILDLKLRPRDFGGPSKRLPEHAAYFDAVDRLSKDMKVRKWLSEYGMTDQKEFAADLFSVVTDPNLDTLHPFAADLKPMLDDYRKALIDGGYWQPSIGADPALEAMRGQRVKDLNAAKRGTVYAPQKAGLLPQSTIDTFAQQFVGVGKHVESNPDVARTAQMFGQWSQAAVFNGLMKGDRAVHADLLQRLGGMPTGAAVPYNMTEGITHQIAVDAMKRKFDDAFRLQYFSQDRSMLERSVNHPMFGMYPASYMWGKLMPEIVQFIAQRPFGIRTGGALTASMHAQSAIALRREFDPSFDVQLEKLGHSQAMSFAGYLLPTVPWDVGASAPIWMKDIAAQGARNQLLADAHKPVEDFNVVQPLTDVAAKLDPIVQNAAWAGRAIDELNGPNTPAEQRKAAIEAATGGIKASNISPLMSSVLDELKAALSH